MINWDRFNSDEWSVIEDVAEEIQRTKRSKFKISEESSFINVSFAEDVPEVEKIRTASDDASFKRGKNVIPREDFAVQSVEEQPKVASPFSVTSSILLRDTTLSPEYGRRDFSAAHHNITHLFPRAPSEIGHFDKYTPKPRDIFDGLKSKEILFSGKTDSFSSACLQPSGGKRKRWTSTCQHTGLSVNLGNLGFGSGKVSTPSASPPVPSDQSTPATTPENGECKILGAADNAQSSNRQILGTPDYLAPELIKQIGHGKCGHPDARVNDLPLN